LLNELRTGGAVVVVDPMPSTFRSPPGYTTVSRPRLPAEATQTMPWLVARLMARIISGDMADALKLMLITRAP